VNFAWELEIFHTEILATEEYAGTTAYILFKYDWWGLPEGSHDITAKLYSKEELSLLETATGKPNQIFMDGRPTDYQYFPAEKLYRPTSLWDHIQHSKWDIGFFIKHLFRNLWMVMVPVDEY
jgi:hypothetical protein